MNRHTAATPASGLPKKLVGALNARDAGLTGAQKAAILLTSVGVEAASKVLKHLRDTDVEQISVEIAKLKNVSSERVETVMLEFRDLSMARSFMTEGGPGFAQKALETALGQQRAEDIMFRIQAATKVSGFHMLQTIETPQLMALLDGERPQTLALILSHLSPRKSAEVIAAISAERQGEVAYRLATMAKASPDVIRTVEEVLRQKIGSILGDGIDLSGGVEHVADILNNSPRSVESLIMDEIQSRDPELASSIKSLMFIFDDLVHVNERDLQRVLVEVDQKDLVIALKGASPDLQNRLLKNVSERAAVVIKEEMELLGPVKVSDVEEAQRNILEVAQELEQRQEISLSRSGDDVLV